MDKLFIAVIMLTALIAGYVIYDTSRDVGVQIDGQLQTASVARNSATSVQVVSLKKEENKDMATVSEDTVKSPKGNYILSEVNGQKIENGYSYTLLITNTKISGRICNSFSGAYKINKDTISVAQLSASKMACQGEAGLYEEIFFKVINSSPTFVNKEGQMTLGFGADNLVFIHVYE
jgi:heat shock protein HslJ